MGKKRKSNSKKISFEKAEKIEEEQKEKDNPAIDPHDASSSEEEEEEEGGGGEKIVVGKKDIDKGKEGEEESESESDDDDDNNNSEDEEEDDDDDDADSNNDKNLPKEKVDDKDDSNNDKDEEEKDNNNDDDNNTRKKKKKIKKLSLKKTQDFNAKLRKRGVLYIARIPPRMGPAKVKQLMSEFGVVTRVYLVEEDKAARKKRKKAAAAAGGGGGGGKRYLEGWVEFEKRRVAKQVGLSLNNTPITNYKRSVHYGDLWNVKFLRKFQWSHLTEKVAYERRVREQKLKIEMISARRENAAYASLVEAGKKMDRIEERRQKKKKRDGRNDEQENGGGGGGDVSNKKRKFRQTKPVDGREDGSGKAKRAVLNALV